ncbi:hypothetical protein [Nostoc sp.]
MRRRSPPSLRDAPRTASLFTLLTQSGLDGAGALGLRVWLDG